MNTNQVLHFNPLIEKGRSFDHFQFLSASGSRNFSSSYLKVGISSLV